MLLNRLGVTPGPVRDTCRKQANGFLIDGPLQYDTAFIPREAKAKRRTVRWRGSDSLFIFADLNTGNTTYKAVQRSINVIKIGRMLQGPRRPVNHLLRRALPKSFWSKWEPQAIEICLSAA